MDFRLACGQLQRNQTLRAVGRHSERGENRHAHDATRHPHLEVEAVQEQDRVPLLRQIAPAPLRELLLESRDDAGHRALGQVVRAEQGLERLADPPRVRAGQVRTQDRLIDLARSARVARHYFALELPRTPVVTRDPTTGHWEGLRSELGRDPPRLVAIAIAATIFGALVTTAAERFAQLFFEDRLHRFKHASAQQVSDVPAQADDLRLVRGTFRHGVTFHRLPGDFALQLGRLRRLHYFHGTRDTSSTWSRSSRDSSPTTSTMPDS